MLVCRPIARRVVGLECSYFLFTCVYQCCSASCGHRFYATNPKVIGALSEDIGNSLVFPVVMSHRGAVDIAVVREMRCLLNEGVSVSAFRRKLVERHESRISELEAAYAARCYHVARRTPSLKMMNMVRNEEGEKWPPCRFSRSKLSYHEVPSASYLEHLYILDADNHRAYILVDTLKRSCKSLAWDFSHKICKHMANLNGHRVFDALFQATNEIGEISMFSFCVGTGQAQVSA